MQASRSRGLTCIDPHVTDSRDLTVVPWVIIHHQEEEADLMHALQRNVKDDGCFIVARTKRVLHGGFLLFQAPPITKHNVGIRGACDVHCVEVLTFFF